jgi:hypothetical protein
MLNKGFSETNEFATEPVTTVTVSPSLLNGAANDGHNERSKQQINRARRTRRQFSPITSHVGGWKVRMW